MRRFSLGLVAVFALGLSALVGATPAVAYPDISCNITDPGQACGGRPVTLTASVSPAIGCSTISITYRGVTQSGTGSAFTATFPTRKVSKRTVDTDTASCTYTDDQTGAVQTVSTSGRVILFVCNDNANNNGNNNGDDDDDDGDDDDSDGNHGHLPNTGGERLLWLIIGGLLLIGGGVTVASARDGEAKNS